MLIIVALGAGQVSSPIALFTARRATGGCDELQLVAAWKPAREVG
jgi:hypothetical protein